MRASMSMKFFTGLQDLLGLYDPSSSPSPPSPSSAAAPIVALFASASATIHQPTARKRSTTNINKEEVGDERVSRCSHSRTVHFPHDDHLLVSGYHDAPRNAFSSPQVYDVASISAAYENACKRLRIAANPTVERQIACFHQVAGIRQECLSLKGQRLSMLHMECLEEIFKRVQFDTLDFEYTFIDDDAAVSLAEMLEFYDSTVKLNLSFNKQINIRGWQALFRAIKNCQSLQLLNLRYTSLSERALPVLARTLRSQPSLTSLHLENIALSGKNLLLLVCALKTNTVLKELYLGDNSLQPSDGATLYQLITGNSSLQMIDLRNNQLQDCGLRHICDALKHKDTLQKSTLSALVLWNNRITSASMDSLASALKENSKLETLNIGNNNLSVEGITALKPALLVNSSLQRLGLQATNLDCQCAIVLAECLADNHVMVRVDLRDNAQIGSAGLLALHLAMKMNTSITLLNLDNSCANSGSAKVKEYHEQFRMYFDEIKSFCERNKQLALKKLSVHSGVSDTSESESSTESSDEDEPADREAKKESDVAEGLPKPVEVSDTKKETVTVAPANEKNYTSTPRKRTAWKITRSSSLTCTELVEDINERIVQMSQSLPSLDEADLEVAEKKPMLAPLAPPPAKAELGKSPSLPLLPVMDLGTDSTVTIKKKPRRFSVSLSTLADFKSDAPRAIPARFKVQRVDLPSCSKPSTLPIAATFSGVSSSVPSTPQEVPKSNEFTASTSRLPTTNDTVESDGSSDFLDDDFVVVPNEKHPKMVKRKGSLENIQTCNFEDAQDNGNSPSEETFAARSRIETVAADSEMSRKKEPPDISFDQTSSAFVDELNARNSAENVENTVLNSQGNVKKAEAGSKVAEWYIGDGVDSVSDLRFSEVADKLKKDEEVGEKDVNSPNGSNTSEQQKISREVGPNNSCVVDERSATEVNGCASEYEVFEPPASANDLSVFSVTDVSRHGGHDFESREEPPTAVASVTAFSLLEKLPANEASETLTKQANSAIVSASFVSRESEPLNQKTNLTPSGGRLTHPRELILNSKRVSDEDAVKRVVKDLVNFVAYEVGDDESYRSSPLKHLTGGPVSTPSPVRSFAHTRCSAVGTSTDECDMEAVQAVVRGLVRDVLVLEKEALKTNLRRRRERLRNALSPDAC